MLLNHHPEELLVAFQVRVLVFVEHKVLLGAAAAAASAAAAVTTSAVSAMAAVLAGATAALCAGLGWVEFGVD